MANARSGDNAVIPNVAKIRHTFAYSRDTWRELAHRANATWLRKDTVDLTRLALRAPEMPANMEGIKELCGQATWTMTPDGGGKNCPWTKSATTGAGGGTHESKPRATRTGEIHR